MPKGGGPGHYQVKAENKVIVPIASPSDSTLAVCHGHDRLAVAIVASAHVVITKRDSGGATIAWAGLICLTPIVGAILTTSGWGSRGSGGRKGKCDGGRASGPRVEIGTPYTLARWDEQSRRQAGAHDSRRPPPAGTPTPPPSDFPRGVAALWRPTAKVC